MTISLVNMTMNKALVILSKTLVNYVYFLSFSTIPLFFAAFPYFCICATNVPVPSVWELYPQGPQNWRY